MMPSSNLRAPETLARPTAFRRVMVCLDRSPAAETVLPLAYHVARMERAPITLLHVLEALSDAPDVHATDALEWEIVREEARGYLAELVERARETTGVTVDGKLAEGPMPYRINALAEEMQADLLVLSTRGKGSGTGTWKLGGTARKILALARTAALIVPADLGDDASPRVPPERLLVPLDGSARGEHVLPTAARLARAGEAEILLAHVVRDRIRTELLSSEEDLELARQLADRIVERAEEYLDRVRSQLAASGVTARTLVRRGTDHREGLVALAAAEQVDLTLMSAHGAVCNPRRRLGSVTSYFVAHAPSPVLVIQDLPERRGRWARSRSSRLPPRSADAASRGA